MKKVHSAPHPFALENLRHILEIEGIPSEVRTPFLGAARGDIPATECWSELWVLDDSDANRALALIRAAREQPQAAGSGWTCPRCREENEPQFDACWHCGTVRSTGHV